MNGMNKRITLLLLLVASSSCTRSDPIAMVVIDHTKLRDAQGEVKRPLRLGETITVHEGSLYDRGRSDLWFFANDDVVRKGPALAALPATTERRYAQPLGAVILRFDPVTREHVGVRRLKAREPVDVVPHPTAGRLVSIKDGEVEGTVDTRMVEREPATAERMFARAKRLFAEGDYEQARWFAEQVQAIDPQHTSAARMAAALQIERGEKGGWKAWVKVKPPPLPSVPPSAPAAAGEPAYVIASNLTLRQRPSKRSASLSLLPFGAEVRVAAVEGRWARVAVQDVVLRSKGARMLGSFGRLSDKELLTIDELVIGEASRTKPQVTDGGVAEVATPTVDAGALGDGETPSAPAATERADQVGWVSVAFLDKNVPDVGALQAAAEAARLAPDHELAIVLYERLAAAQRGTRAFTIAIDEALLAERWRRALVLIKEREKAKGSADRGPFDVTIDRYAGCKGDLLNYDTLDLEPWLPPPAAEVSEALLARVDMEGEGVVEDKEAIERYLEDIQQTKAPPAWPRDVCITRLADGPWCEPFVMDPFIGIAEEELTEDERRSMQEEHEGEVAANAVFVGRVNSAHSRREARFDDLLRAATGAATERFVIRLDNTSEDDASPGKVMVVYTAVQSVNGSCGNILDEGYERVAARYFRAPTVAGGSELDLWFEGGDHTVGVAFASTEEAARRFVAEKLIYGPYRGEDREEVTGPDGPEINVFGQVEVSDPIDTCDVDTCGC
jgi:hypothetical protein